VTVPAASIVDSVRIGSPPRLTLRGPGERLESVQVRPGPDAALVAGTVNWGRAPARFRVGVRAGLLAGGPAPDHDVPLVLVAQHLGGTTSTRTLHSGPADDGWRWVEQVVDGDSDLRVRLSAAAAAPTLVVHELRVERLGDAGTAAVAEDPVATGDLSARWDAGLPVPGFTLARSARTTEFTARLTRAWLAGLVVPLPTTRPLSAVVMAVGPRSGPVLVLRRRSARRLLAPVAVVGRRRRRVPMRPDDALYVLGRRRSVVGFSLAAAD
jgi:hypothetical protein